MMSLRPRHLRPIFKVGKQILIPFIKKAIYEQNDKFNNNLYALAVFGRMFEWTV